MNYKNPQAHKLIQKKGAIIDEKVQSSKVCLFRNDSFNTFLSVF